MEVERLKKFVMYQNTTKISSSLENVDEHNCLQYESKLVMDRKLLTEEHTSKQSTADSQPPVSKCDLIFAKENEEKRFLANKISPANNPVRTRGCGRGILSKTELLVCLLIIINKRNFFFNLLR